MRSIVYLNNRGVQELKTDEKPDARDGSGPESISVLACLIQHCYEMSRHCVANL